MQGILLCLLPFLTTCSTAHFCELTSFVNMWSSLKCYHPPGTSLHSCGASYYNHTRWVEQNMQRVLIHVQRMEVVGDDTTDWEVLPVSPAVGMVGQDKQLHVGMPSSAPATVGPQDKQKTGD